MENFFGGWSLIQTKLNMECGGVSLWLCFSPHCNHCQVPLSTKRIGYQDSFTSKVSSPPPFFFAMGYRKQDRQGLK